MTKLAWAFYWLAIVLPVSAQVNYQDLKRADAKDWLTYSGSYSSQRHSLLKQINTSDVHRLVPGMGVPRSRGERLECTPVVADGVMYFTQGGTDVFALDGQSGRLIWSYHYHTTFSRIANRGLAVYGNRVYFTSRDVFLVALDAGPAIFFGARRSLMLKQVTGRGSPPGS